MRKRLSLESDIIMGPLLALPMVVVMLGLIAYPFVSAFSTSMTVKMVGYPGHFAWFKNYVDLVKDELFRRTVVNSFAYTIVAVVLKLVIGMAMALVLNRAIRFRQFFRGLLLLPWVLPTVVISLNWLWVFDADNGILNWTLMNLGIVRDPVRWLSDPLLAMLCAIMVNTWRGFPFFGATLLTRASGHSGRAIRVGADRRSEWLTDIPIYHDSRAALCSAHHHAPIDALDLQRFSNRVGPHRRQSL